MPDIILDSDEVEFAIAGVLHRQPCDIVLRPTPTPGVLVRVHGLELPARMMALLGQRPKVSFHFTRAGVDCDAFAAGSHEEAVDYIPSLQPIIWASSTSLRAVRFDLVNFPSFLVSDGTRLTRDRDDLDISVSGWNIAIRPPRQSAEVGAFQSPLYSITHSCTLRRTDGTAFTSETAQDMLELLHDALTFAAGRWIPAVFVEGVGDDGVIPWKLWGPGRLRPGSSYEGTWFDLHDGDALCKVVALLFDLRQNNTRANEFRTALYWYVRSGTEVAGVDGGLILLQAALERLSWHHLVTEHSVFTPEAFRKVSASGRLKELIQYCGIPTDIPAGLTALASIAAQNGWDGPRAVTSARNKLVHPEGLRPLPWTDLWKLARWYVELVLLNMLGYTGNYSNRTLAHRWVGAVEPVPWH
jgi:hypothetical protein